MAYTNTLIGPKDAGLFGSELQTLTAGHTGPGVPLVSEKCLRANGPSGRLWYKYYPFHGFQPQSLPDIREKGTPAASTWAE